MVLQLRGLIAAESEVAKLAVHVIRQLEGSPVIVSLVLLFKSGCSYRPTPKRVLLLLRRIVANHPDTRADLVELCTNLIFSWSHFEKAETRVLRAPGCGDRVEAMEERRVIFRYAMRWVLLVRLLILLALSTV